MFNILLFVFACKSNQILAFEQQKSKKITIYLLFIIASQKIRSKVREILAKLARLLEFLKNRLTR